MSKILLILTIVILSSCTSVGYKVKEDMLPNGHWVFGVYTSDTCDQLIEADKNKNNSIPNSQFSIPILSKKSLSDVMFPQNNEVLKTQCIELFKRSLSNRSKELCGNESFSLYGCLNTENESDTSGLRLMSNDVNHEYKLKCYLNCNSK